MAYCTLRVRNFVARTPEHWADASLCERTHSFRYFTIPHGGTKKNKSLGACFFIRCLQRHVINACVVCNCNKRVSPTAHCTLRVRNFVARTPEHWADASLCEQTHSFRYFTIPHGGTKKTSPFGLVFFIRCSQRHVINACVVCNCNKRVSSMAYCTLRVRRKLCPNIY